MSLPTHAKPLDPHAVKAMLSDGRELALIDLREELIFSRNHLLWARSIPLSRLELRFARLVPRKDTRIVLCDDGDGLVERATSILAAAGYSGEAIDPDRVRVWFGDGDDLQLLDRGLPLAFDRDRASALLRRDPVVLRIDLGLGTAGATVWTCDLSAEYVRVNAEYTT